MWQQETLQLSLSGLNAHYVQDVLCRPRGISYSRRTKSVTKIPVEVVDLFSAELSLAIKATVLIFL